VAGPTTSHALRDLILIYAVNCGINDDKVDECKKTSHSPTNALFIKLGLKFTLKFT
jgi:hypothetical protein